jgi:hypothetical protein
MAWVVSESWIPPHWLFPACHVPIRIGVMAIWDFPKGRQSINVVPLPRLRFYETSSTKAFLIGTYF